MSFAEYLKEKQHIVYETFLNAYKSDHISQAYLIKGQYGSPTLEVAKYLAKSLICPNGTPFACDSCPTCHRFDEGNYVDFILLDAQKETLKVSDIEDLETRFVKKTLEKAGKLIYIIHHVENMNRESINALLKFLEEPGEGIYAFLTTENETKVLPTILSRCQHLKLLPPSKEDLKEEMEKSGLDNDDLDLLSSFASDEKTLLSIKDSESYKKVKETILKYIDSLTISLDSGYYYMQKEGIVNIKSKEDTRLFIDILAKIFKEMLNVSYKMPLEMVSLKDKIKFIAAKIDNIEECYKEIMFTRGRIELNVNTSLILEHLAYFIAKGGK